jgi:hypothetical protein
MSSRIEAMSRRVLVRGTRNHMRETSSGTGEKVKTLEPLAGRIDCGP